MLNSNDKMHLGQKTTEITDASIINVSGEMDQQLLDQKLPPGQFYQLLQFPVQVPQAKEWFLQRKQNVRPWLQFVQTSNFRAPPSLPRLSRRIVRNLEYFQSNYLFVFLGLSAYCLITSPLLLLAVAGSLFACYRLSKRHSDVGTAPVRIFGRELTLTQQYGVVAACSLPIYYLAGAGAAMFWTLGASCLIISMHAAFYNIDGLVVEPEDAFGITQQV